MSEPDWAEHAIWWHVYPLGFAGAEKVATPEPGAAHRLLDLIPWLDYVVELGASVTTPLGTWDDVLVTEDWTPLSPSVTERKYYARGIGLVMERHISGGDAGFEIVEHTEP